MENQAPWQWHNVKQRYSHAENLINNLVSEGKYEFTLTGKFEDIMGSDASIHWVGDPTPAGKRDAESVSETDSTDTEKPVEFKPQEGDPAPVNPAPPVVKIKMPKEINNPRIAGMGNFYCLN